MIRYRFKLIYAVWLCGIFMSTSGFAQDVAMSADDSVVAATQDDQGALFLNYKGASLINVLGSLSEISKINFVAGNEIAKREVNMTLDGVTLEQALQAISNGSNVTYTYMPESKIIMFRASSDQPNVAPLYTRVFKLYFLRASKIQEIDAGKSSGGGSGSSGGGLQSLGSSNSSSQSSSTASQDIPILKIMEKMLSERGSVSVDDRSNSVIVTDTEDRLARVAAVVAELDRPLNQVLINVLLVETFEDLDRQFGIEWSGDFGTLTGGSANTRFPLSNGNKNNWLGSLLKANSEPLDPLGSFADSDATNKLGSKDFSSLVIQAKALQTASKLHILAKPNVLVMDNQPAIIKIATNAAIGSQTVVGSSGGSENAASVSSSTQAERAEVGTILRVTPQINSQDQITMTIEPTFATVDTSTLNIDESAVSQTGDTTVRA